MSKETLSEMRQMDNASLMARILDLKREALNLRFQKASGQLEDIHAFGRVRRRVARIKTILSMRKKFGKEG